MQGLVGSHIEGLVHGKRATYRARAACTKMAARQGQTESERCSTAQRLSTHANQQEQQGFGLM